MKFQNCIEYWWAFIVCMFQWSLEVSSLVGYNSLISEFQGAAYYSKVHVLNNSGCPSCSSLWWLHNGHNWVSNHQPRHCLLNRLFERTSKKTSKLRVTGLCAGNSPGTGEFPAQMASNSENVSIWWRHHVYHSLISNIAKRQHRKSYSVKFWSISQHLLDSICS